MDDECSELAGWPDIMKPTMIKSGLLRPVLSPVNVIQIAHPWWATAIVPNLVILWLHQK